MSDFEISADWQTEAGYRAIVIWRSSAGHHCGYVAVPPSNILYGKSYSERVPKPDWLAEEPIGKRGPIDLLIESCAPDRENCSVTTLFNVHGGITYSGNHGYPVKQEGVHWFGYDCAHCDDKTAYGDGIFRDLDYCKAECESLAKQLKLFEPNDQTKS